MKRAGIAVIFELRDMIAPPGCMTTRRGGPDGWVRAVPEPFYDGLWARLRSAWEVVAGRAYPCAWPQPGDLERALDPHPHPPRDCTVPDYRPAQAGDRW
jgi:hypothetical protein